MIYITCGDTYNSIGTEVLLHCLYLLPAQDLASFVFLIPEKDLCDFLNKKKMPEIYFEKSRSLLWIGNKKSLSLSLLKTHKANSFYSASELSLREALNVISPSDVLVTLPTTKQSLPLGYTAFFSQYFKNATPTMIFLSPSHFLTLITDHIPLKFVSREYKKYFFSKMQTIVDNWPSKIFLEGLVLCGLNPHAGEGGLIGQEEQKYFKSYLQFLEKFSLPIIGPISADTAHHLAFNKNLQNRLFISFYHDQLLPWFKGAFSPFVTQLTLGLPFIRLSVGHGTAPDKYLQFSSNPLSCLSLLKWAMRLSYGHEFKKENTPK